MRGKRLTILFEGLHRTLWEFVGDSTWLQEHEDLLMGEWSSEVDSGGMSGSGSSDGNDRSEEVDEGREEW